jgi:hypothetical protein
LCPRDIAEGLLYFGEGPHRGGAAVEPALIFEGIQGAVRGCCRAAEIGDQRIAQGCRIAPSVRERLNAFGRGQKALGNLALAEAVFAASLGEGGADDLIVEPGGTIAGGVGRLAITARRRLIECC